MGRLAPVEREAGHPLGPVAGAAEERPQRERAAVVEVGVVLPGVADAPEHLNALVRAADGGVHRDQRGHRGGELAAGVEAPGLDGPGGVPGRGRGLLRRREHPGTAVLDRLELADGPPELVADLRVVGGGGHRPVGDAAGLGGQQDRGQRRHRAGRQPAEDPFRGDAQLIRADPAGLAGQVEAVQLRDLHVGGIHHHPAAVAILPVQGGGQDQHVGQPGARDRPAGAVDHQRAGGAGAGGADARREPDRPGERAARHVLDQPIQGVGPGAVQDGAGEHGRQEGPRHQGPSQLFHGDRQLRQAVALAAE